LIYSIFKSLLLTTKLIQQCEGHRFDNPPVSSMPWRPSTNLVFLLTMPIIIAKYNKLNHYLYKKQCTFHTAS